MDKVVRVCNAMTGRGKSVHLAMITSMVELGARPIVYQNCQYVPLKYMGHLRGYKMCKIPGSHVHCVPHKEEVQYDCT
jgi:hypothetical protein